MREIRPDIIVQARTGSHRLPRKVLLPLGAGTVLEYVIERCRMSRLTRKVVLATTALTSDDELADLGRSLDVRVFRGSEDDVLSRFLDAAHQLGSEVIVRVCADCPLIDPLTIDAVIQHYSEENVADHIGLEGHPVGLGAAELVTVAALSRAARETSPTDTWYREHVTTYIKEHEETFRLRNVPCPEWQRGTKVWLAVDHEEDLALARRVVEYFAPRRDFTTDEILAFLDAHPDVANLNQGRRHE